MRTHLGLSFFRPGLATALAAVAALPALWVGAAEEPAKAPAEREKFELPGLKLDLKERFLDVDATICLEAGALELIACTVDTKEHESIVSVSAAPSDIHAALLLIGAQPGSPANRRPLGDDSGRWIFTPPTGDKIRVSLVVPTADGGTVERPIDQFIRRAADRFQDVPEEELPDFPTDEFLFTGSVLYQKQGDGPPVYLATRSGNVITISTFGDELVGLSGNHSQENGSLMWEVDPEKTPKLGTKVTLRLRPVEPREAPQKPAKEKADS